MHGETNNSPRQAPCSVRRETINHIIANAMTNTLPKILKKLRFSVLASFSVASE
ncbi:hypothetical protein D3C80_2063980 [compost metagenome]